MPIPTLVTFALYILAMVFIGAKFFKGTGELSDYILGGRKLSSPVAALSAGASDMSGWLLLGLPGALYAGGWVNIYMAVGLTIGAYLNWQFVAPRLRAQSQAQGDALTIPDFFENHFADKSRLIRSSSAAIILAFYGIYTASGLVSGAILFEESFGLSYHMALLIGAAVIVSYTFLGGFNAVSWTDFFQGLLMLFALIATPVFLLSHIDLRQIVTFSSDKTQATGWITVASLLAWGLGYFGQPHILVRFMSLRDLKRMPVARNIAMSWMVLSLCGAICTGLFGRIYFADAPLEQPEKVFIALTQILFNPWMAGLLLAAILAAVMSTVDSQLLVCASALTEDIYRAFLHKNASQKELIWLSRAAVIAVACLALVLAWNPKNRVLDLVAYAWAGFGAAFGPLMLFSLLDKRTTRAAALAGILSGAATVFIWRPLKGGIFDLYELAPAFIISSLIIFTFSRIQNKLRQNRS
ncbi:MAG: sodium/proline symporter PutP [Myxococcales bacterium]|nr:MAG: sodium/proline symporter PutP [Myxococcales bacterium]